MFIDNFSAIYRIFFYITWQRYSIWLALTVISNKNYIFISTKKTIYRYVWSMRIKKQVSHVSQINTDSTCTMYYLALFVPYALKSVVFLCIMTKNVPTPYIICFEVGLCKYQACGRWFPIVLNIKGKCVHFLSRRIFFYKIKEQKHNSNSYCSDIFIWNQTSWVLYGHLQITVGLLER